jgi:hypothetical protein
MSNANIYLHELHINIPRLLASFDTNPLSPSYGEGDRFHWAWKLMDFGNGTFQGAADGLARLRIAELLPNGMDPKAIDQRIAACFIGAEHLCRHNGSMEEAFPYESSFCVTALVAYDLLTSIELQGNLLSQKERDDRLKIVAPMIYFLHKADEHHAFISNHLATAAAALYKWYSLTGESGEKRGWSILNRVLKQQSEEGWYEEYGGADPGYQSLCTYYLADLHRLRPDLDLGPSLYRSMRFLWHFAHPDGSFGGIYGSRHTRLYYPAGIEFLATECPEASKLAAFMRESIANQTTVTLSAMDAPNLVPMFNAYAWATALRSLESEQKVIGEDLCLPALKESYRAEFPKAGLYIRGEKAGYTVVNVAKGGALLHSDRATGCVTVNGGVVARDTKGHHFSTQALRPDRKIEIYSDRISVTSPFYAVHRQQPKPWQFVVLRLLSITLMRSLWLGNLLKKLLVRILVTGGHPLKSKVQRTITWGVNEPEITDKWELTKSEKLMPVEVFGDFSTIHMASQGYWQKQDDSPKTYKLKEL